MKFAADAVPLDDILLHRWLKKSEMSAPLAFGAVKRQVGVLHQCVGIAAVHGRDRDSKAGADKHRLTLSSTGCANRFHQPRRQPAISDLGASAMQDNGELIATKSGDDIGSAE